MSHHTYIGRSIDTANEFARVCRVALVDDDQWCLSHDFAPIEGGVEEGIGEGDDEEEEDSPAVGEDMTELPEADLPEVTYAESERSDDIHRSIKRYSRHSGGTSSDEAA